MKNYDWIVIGGGIAGAALSYELAKKGFAVLLLERDATMQNATRFSYGGLAYWSGTTDLTRQLCAEGIERHRNLSAQLDADTEFRELDLLLTIDAGVEPEKVAANYAHFAIPPQLLSVAEACELEPLLNKSAIAGALTVRHGHISPTATNQAYCQGFLRLGGTLEFAEVTNLITDKNRISGVKTVQETYACENVVICAGGWSRSLLKAAGISAGVYFTRAEILETAPVDVKLRTLVMPALLKRFELEAQSSKIEVDHLWDEPGKELLPPILDAGAVGFNDGSLRIGQLSRTLSDLNAKVDRQRSETAIRAGIGKILPAVANLPATWHDCIVAFSADRLPVVGEIGSRPGLHVFSGLSNPLVVLPALAERFANSAAVEKDWAIELLSPNRFAEK
ncbi:MAG: FAD-binding oxidoreductase [Microcoleus sp. PH2017_10_PVI_O_A]|uniref:NAD(P)/FAD-dependent oxidoreductase n=1 Tax=unclassified Microcoleus TaxID=2642155 RepID=UPI001D26F719|nr:MULTISPECIES: FAD-binding oxidoreductase [unclassified Microcoleus]TAE78520.1 MAG: FAD-binding oxidoreductase [Oscillatoriales cyanobacterium]MCC3408185.1 FAD-binding oxidoreductase [Microcoleus sp. PH2017_10_PVI_O_A]MCC3462875.1 FAD-binding oxidoreductase [Microcoleus sp. PH2017_11_PCY_U_A]MCC3480730.1 FAD-binding oxidoreductase [Microcoleus sp. PH2017_12_PCY_D_A]MCC3530656.1 FAD-binding oxidoreductase [Microcoleus sp. PH2017_21_RUC_O_A]